MISYFFSKWIVNFGVVPLLLFNDFLLLPILTFLFDLLNLVILVFETIFQLHKIKVFKLVNIFRTKFLPILIYAVKALLLALALCVMAAHAKSAQDTERTTLLLSIGEHKEIKYSQISKFTVTNTTIIGHKHKKKINTIIIKGLKLGYTELVIWSKKLKKTYKVYVLEKKRQLKILHIGETLKEMNLDIRLAGPLIIATGEVSDLQSYYYLKHLEKENLKKLLLKVKLGIKLKNKIIMSIYSRFFNSYEDYISCNSSLLNIICTISNHINKSFYKDLEKRYLITFIKTLSHKQKQNYILKIRFYKLATTESESLKKGFSRISSRISQLLNNNWNSLINDNKFKLEGSNYFLQTMGTHEVVMTLEEKTILKIGAETLFKNTNSKDGSAISSWKFSGFNISTHLKSMGRTYQLKYTIKFSKSSNPKSSRFSNSQSESSIYINLKKTINIFTSNSLHIGTEEQLLPYLSKFPILGELFKDNSKIQLTERIMAYVKLEYI